MISPLSGDVPENGRSFSPVRILFLITIGISALTRVVLFTKSAAMVDFSFKNVAGIFGIGLFYDAINAGYVAFPLAVYCWLVPGKFSMSSGHRRLLSAFFAFYIFLLLFNAAAEWFFWDEFGSRFNFIAVDYLVYTTEVIGNIRQSYPVTPIIILAVLVTAAAVLLLRPLIRRVGGKPLSFRKRTCIMFAYTGCLLLAGVFGAGKYHRFSRNTYVNELAGNGLYELFAAYFNNELDYPQFYRTLPDRKAFRMLRAMVQTPESRYVDQTPFSIERDIVNPGAERRMNVILISVESLSAEFLGAFGNTQRITPNLDSLAGQSLVFTNLFATGTRTVRGLEALTVAPPPTPGQSIVRRPKNEHLFSLGKVFHTKGYQCKFIYGGYSYFDNMGYFFENNGYKVVDRRELKPAEIDYENIWGVADENLFTLAIREIDRSAKTGAPVFAHIMTTSNHRPYTYPEKRIDIPSHTSREGAVKYTDYAIGRFLREARAKSWFRNTLFVIVADHCASSAGKTDLPVNKYKIPMLMYAPELIRPGLMNRLMSQIDVAPTVLGLLNFSYRSKFFGYDIFKLEPGRERAFISTYQLLGYLRHDSLVILKPQRLVATCLPDPQNGTSAPVQENEHLVAEAITWYQTASYQFRHGMMK